MSGEPGGIRVHLKNPRERGDEALEEYLGPNLEMNATYNMIEFDRELLDTPLLAVRDDAWKVTQALKSTVETADVLAKQIADQELLISWRYFFDCIRTPRRKLAIWCQKQSERAREDGR